MTTRPSPSRVHGRRQREIAALLRRAPRVPFGPAFFFTQLAAFLRDRCPAPDERLPAVTLALSDGEVIDVCHVEALASRWLAVAAFEGRHEGRFSTMRTEIVPYDAILRVTVRDVPVDGGIGFRLEHRPAVVSETSAARAALGGEPGVGTGTLPARRPSGTGSGGNRASGAGAAS